MGLLNFREPNQAKWLGMRPGHNGDKVFGSGSVGGGFTTLYTVPASKTYYMTWSMLGTLSLANGHLYMEWVNAALSRQMFIHVIVGSVGSGIDDTAENFNPPIEIPAGHIIRIYSSNASMPAYGSFYGWIE